MYVDHNDYDYDSYYPRACSSMCLSRSFCVTDIICEDNMDKELPQNLLF